MARIQGVDLPSGKRIEYALPYIFGIGLAKSREILTKLAIDYSVRVRDLSETQVAALQHEVSENYVTEGDLRRKESEDIKRLRAIGSYRGLRHARGLPVRGQRTKTNARSRKGPRGVAVAGKRKVSKK